MTERIFRSFRLDYSFSCPCIENEKFPSEYKCKRKKRGGHWMEMEKFGKRSATITIGVD